MFHCLIVDDHPLVRSSIASLLPVKFRKSRSTEAASAEDALRMMKHQKPDLVLLDLGLPGMSGTEALKAIQHLYADIPVLILSASDNLHDMQRCMNAGAHGFINKTEPGNILLAAIESVLNGKKHIPVSLQTQYSEVSHRLKQVEMITARQLDVLNQMREGKRNKEIASTLGISESTIKVHCRDIFKILSVNNRHQAVQESLSLGLLD